MNAIFDNTVLTDHQRYRFNNPHGYLRGYRRSKIIRTGRIFPVIHHLCGCYSRIPGNQHPGNRRALYGIYRYFERPAELQGQFSHRPGSQHWVKCRAADLILAIVIFIAGRLQFKRYFLWKSIVPMIATHFALHHPGI